MSHLSHWKLLVLLCVLLALSGPASAQEELPTEIPPDLPSLEDIRAQQQQLELQRLEADFNFQIGVIADFEKTYNTPSGQEIEVKTPMILLDPIYPETPRVYAKNFPARIISVSRNGEWVIGVASSSSANIEGTSGSQLREVAVSLNLAQGGLLRNIIEFPLYSNFQAVFSPHDLNVIYYCINEPGVENYIVEYHLTKDRTNVLELEGNRFSILGTQPTKPPAMWVTNPNTVRTSDLCLINMEDGAELTSVDFPGITELIAKPDGSALLAVVQEGAEASIGYYQLADQSFHQVPGLVLTNPSVKWTNSGMSVVAKESTFKEDRFLWIDLETGEARELFRAYFQVTHWDLSPEGDALVFITGDEPPTLFVVPTDPAIQGANRISLTDVSNVSWIGCLTPPRNGSWIDNLLDFRF